MMSQNDPFGFRAAVDNDADDLAMFAPKPKAIDKGAAAAASEVAKGSGFSRRTPLANADQDDALPETKNPTVKGARRRISLQELKGHEEKYPHANRVQLNLLAPVPVIVRWRELVKVADIPAWEVLEQAMNALEAISNSPQLSKEGG